MSEHTHEHMVMPKHGEFCWTEVAVTDLEKCKSFYTNVFGWEFAQSKAMDGEMQYLEFSSSGAAEPDAAIYEINADMFGGTAPPPHIAVYVAVDDVDAAAEKAKSLGGSVLVGPENIPNVGRFAVIGDPAGAVISMIALGGGE
ncbi:MAG: VOC family protein [Acidobacteria bacterium]|nr:VOC family protein [Acidobacteriota bacterium]